jgi:DMSO/TMAO reductase YedYZ molybdopterin-dependent catalytic subunit
MSDDERRFEEKRILSEGRLPPGQALTLKFPVLHYGPVPPFDAATWSMRFYGEVEEPLKLSWQQFNQLPHRKVHMDIHCVTKWSKFDTDWEGVSVTDLISHGLLKLKPSAKYVIQHAEYGFTANLPLEVVLQESFLLATHFNGKPLDADHGYPLRGVIGYIPGKEDMDTPYFWKGAKWLRGLEFTSEDRLGFWEQAGYHNTADVWREERYR